MDILTSIETVMDSDLLHYGRQGMKWGVRNGPPYPLHPDQLSLAEKKARRSVFISGSSKTQFEDSGYYRKELPKAIQNKIDEYIKDHAYIVVGDAPGIDRQVQDYLNEKGYESVEIYGPGKQVRYAANNKWKTNPVDAPEFEEMSPEWLRKKDIAMTNDATEGLAIVLDDGAQATRNNVARLREQGKQAEVFILGSDGLDDWEYEVGSYKTFLATMADKRKVATERAIESWKTHTDVDSIIDSMNSDDRYKVLAGDDHYLNFEEGSHVVKRSLTKLGDTAISFVDLLDDGKQLQVALGTRAGDEFRGKGHGYKTAKDAIDWYEQHKYELPYEEIVWGVLVDNYGSIRIAEKLGFEKDESSISDDGTWVNYVKKTNKVSHADTLFAEFVQAEDLEHHGIKGQKWGHRNGPPYPLDQETHEKVTKGEDTGVYKKGSKFYRVSTKEREDLSTTDYKYVTTLKKDRDVYRGPMATDWMYDESESIEDYTKHTIQEIYDNFTKRGFHMYELTFEASKDLKSPSKSERQRMLKELVNEDPTVIDRAYDFFKHDKLTMKDKEKLDSIGWAFDKKRWTKGNGTLGDLAYDPDAFYYFSEALNEAGDIRRQYFDKVNSSGYNMIVDDHDAGILSERPFIVIDPIETLTQVYAEELNGKSIEKSFRRWERAQDWYTEDEKSFVGHSDFLSAVELVLPDDALQYGVLGQKWGIRKWQNKDGTLTPAGRERWINSLKQEAYAASKKWEEYQAVRKQVINMHYDGKFDNELETKMLRLKDEAEEAGAIWGSLRKRIESYLENGPDVSTSEPVEDAPHKVLIPVTDEKKYQHFLDLGYEEKGRNDTWIYMVNYKKNIKHSDNQNDVLAAVETVMDGDIEHHGRRGQKWGVRNGPPYPLDVDRLSARERMLDSSGKKNVAATGERKKWQSSDTLSELASIPYNGLVGGKLTHLGRKHLDKMLSSKELQDFAERNSKSKAYSLKKAGVRKSEQGGSVIDKDTTMQRIADSSDAITDKRKYVSVTSNDQKHYKSIYDKGFLAVQNRDDAAAFKYKGKKELRVADASDVMNYIVDSYGHRKEKKFYSDVKKIEPYRDAFKELYRTGLGSAADLAVANYYDYASFELKRFVKNNLWDGASETGKQTYAKNKQKEILNHYKELGYDAIADVEDVLSGYEYPIILINPSESIRLSGKKKLSHSDLYLAHYRRGGEKKGVRRWQNYDGSLTPAGREHYGIGPPREAKAEDPERATLSKSGIHKQNAQTDIIVGGTKFVRQASAKDDQYHDRKYMSVTKKDVDYWRGEQEAEYTYEAKRNLKVANAQAVVDYIVQDMMGYGQSEEGKKLSSLYEKYRGNTWDHFFEKRSNKKERAQMWKVIAKQRSAYGREGATDSHRQILDHFSQLGYDAMVDINQSWQGMEYPIIVIDPDDSTKLVTKLVRRS